MIPTEGLQQILHQAYNAIRPAYTPAGATLALFKNNVTVGAATVLANLTVADFSGYADLTYAPNFHDAILVGSNAELDGAVGTFSHNGGGTSNTIYGFYLHKDGRLILAANITPKTMSVGTDVIHVQPFIGLSATTPPGTGSASIVLTDTFTDTTGTGIGSHTADTGQTYSGSGNATIQSNTAKDITSGSTSNFFADSGIADATVTLDFTTPSSWSSGVYAGISARAQDTSNFLLMGCFWNGGANHAMFLQKYIATVGTTLDQGPNFTLNTSTAYTLKFRMNKNALYGELWTGGAPIQSVSAVDSTGASRTKHGLWSFVTTGVPGNAFDNLNVYTLPTTP